MGKDWKDHLATFFEDLVIIRHSQQEAREQFNQFCEFIAEPAFEDLEQELRHYRIKSTIRTRKDESIELRVSFPKSRVDNFRYKIYLPKNHLELRLRLIVKGRVSKTYPEEVTEMDFLEDLTPAEILKIDKSVLIQDVIGRYSAFNMKATIRED